MITEDRKKMHTVQLDKTEEFTAEETRALLGVSAGEDGTCLSLGYAQRSNGKANRFSHTREDGDIPCNAFGNAECSFLPRDHPLIWAQGNDEIVFRRTQQGGPLQYRPRFHSLPECAAVGAGSPVFRRIEQPHYPVHARIDYAVDDAGYGKDKAERNPRILFQSFSVPPAVIH